MFLIASRNLFQEKSRLAVSVGGVAFAIILMVVLFGIYNGSIDRDVKFIQESPADIVILRQGMVDMYKGVPLVSLADIEKIRQEPGVQSVTPVISLRPAVEKDDKQYNLIISSFDPSDLSQGPWALSQGTKQITDDEILIPSALAKKLGKSVGDTLIFSESTKSWRIAGLVPDASSFGNNYSWITYSAAQSFITVPNTVSFAFVKLTQPSDVAHEAKVLQAKYPQINVRDKAALVQEEKTSLGDSFLPILQAILAIAVLIGTAVIGITIYTSVLDKSREVGILKAIGISNKQLYLTSLTQALLTTVLGLLVGILLSFAVGWFISTALDLPVQISQWTIAWVSGLALVMGCIASLIPVKRLASIDPAEVFKS